MRVITGRAKGTRLKTLEGLDVRPTTDRVKEGMFSSIHFDLMDAEVLDLFAGSGQLGIEAISRGARSVQFVDSSANSLSVTRENLERTGFLSQAKMQKMDAKVFLRRCPSDSFDIAFLDPPYRMNLLDELLPDLCEKIRSGGKIVCEHEKELQLPQKILNLQLQKQYFYGKIVVSVFVKEQEAMV